MVCVMPLTWLSRSHPHWCFVWVAESCCPFWLPLLGEADLKDNVWWTYPTAINTLIESWTLFMFLLLFAFVFQSFSGLVRTGMASEASLALSEGGRHYLWGYVPCVNASLILHVKDCLLVAPLSHHQVKCLYIISSSNLWMVCMLLLGDVCRLVSSTCGSCLVMSYPSKFGFKQPQNVASAGSMNIFIPHRACHQRVHVAEL